MTTTKERVEDLYAQVVSRLGGDQEEGKALLDELLFHLARSASGPRDIFDDPPRPGPKAITWEETEALRIKVDRRKKSKSLSTYNALLEIYASEFPSKNTGKKSEGEEIKANAWAKTKANQLSHHRQAPLKASKILSDSNM